MRWIRLALVPVMLGALLATAHAQRDLLKDLKFTVAEEEIIARNEVLKKLRRTDPDGVKDILDALTSLTARQARQAPAPTQPRIVRRPKEGAPAKIPFDPERNPDLLLFYRASPEAAHDLLQLLKQAGAARR